MKNIKTRAIELGQDLRNTLYHIAEIEKIYRRGSLYSIQPPQPVVKDVHAFCCLAGIDSRFELEYCGYSLNPLRLQVRTACTELNWIEFRTLEGDAFIMRYYKE